MGKVYQNITTSIDFLVNKKNIDRSSIQTKCFYEKTYLDLINAYSDLVAIGRGSDGKRMYDVNTSFDEFLEYNRIDFGICSYLHVLIGAYEKMLKSFLMHKYCSKMAANGDLETKDYKWIDDYLAGNEVFDLLKMDEWLYEGIPIDTNEDTKQKRVDTLTNIKTIATTEPETGILKHYYDKYSYLPFYVVIHSLSLGDLLILFSLLKTDDKIELMNIFYATDKKYNTQLIYKFEKDGTRIKWIRNIVNHYEPLFPFVKNSSKQSVYTLCDLLKKMKKYYLSTVSLSHAVTFSEQKTYRSRNKYSRDYHLRIEMVIDSLR